MEVVPVPQLKQKLDAYYETLQQPDPAVKQSTPGPVWEFAKGYVEDKSQGGRNKFIVYDRDVASPAKKEMFKTTYVKTLAKHIEHKLRPMAQGEGHDATGAGAHSLEPYPGDAGGSKNNKRKLPAPQQQQQQQHSSDALLDVAASAAPAAGAHKCKRVEVKRQRKDSMQLATAAADVGAAATAAAQADAAGVNAVAAAVAEADLRSPEFKFEPTAAAEAAVGERSFELLLGKAGGTRGSRRKSPAPKQQQQQSMSAFRAAAAHAASAHHIRQTAAPNKRHRTQQLTAAAAEATAAADAAPVDGAAAAAPAPHAEPAVAADLFAGHHYGEPAPLQHPNNQPAGQAQQQLPAALAPAILQGLQMQPGGALLHAAQHVAQAGIHPEQPLLQHDQQPQLPALQPQVPQQMHQEPAHQDHQPLLQQPLGDGVAAAAAAAIDGLEAPLMDLDDLGLLGPPPFDEDDAQLLPHLEDFSNFELGARGFEGELGYRMLFEEVHVDSADSSSHTALHGAAAGGHADTADWLLKQGANPYARDINSYTPLMVASMCGKTGVVELLLEHRTFTSLEGGPHLQELYNAGMAAAASSLPPAAVFEAFGLIRSKLQACHGADAVEVLMQAIGSISAATAIVQHDRLQLLAENEELKTSSSTLRSDLERLQTQRVAAATAAAYVAFAATRRAELIAGQPGQQQQQQQPAGPPLQEAAAMQRIAAAQTVVLLLMSDQVARREGSDALYTSLQDCVLQLTPLANLAGQLQQLQQQQQQPQEQVQQQEQIAAVMQATAFACSAVVLSLHAELSRIISAEFKLLLDNAKQQLTNIAA